MAKGLQHSWTLWLLQPVTQVYEIKKFIHGHNAYPDLHIMFTCSHMDSYTNKANHRTSQ